jgi:hypothetical protein
VILAQDAADLAFDGPALILGETAIEGVVEAQVVGCDERTGLACRIAERIAQRSMEFARRLGA